MACTGFSGAVLIRSTLCSLRDFSTLEPLLQMALVSFVLGLVFAGIELWTQSTPDYDLEGASVETFSARVLEVGPGRILLEEAEGGEVLALTIARGISQLNADPARFKGQTLTVSHLRHYLLSCSREGEALCRARCSSASSCRDSRREYESSLSMLYGAWAVTLASLGAYAWGRRGRRPWRVGGE